MAENIRVETRWIGDNPMMSTIHAQMEHCENILNDKFGDYGNHEDPYWHFNRAAELLEQTPEQVLMTLFSKHLTCIVEMAKNPGASVYLRWLEKLTDAINYLLILSSMVNARYNAPQDPGEVIDRIARGK